MINGPQRRNEESDEEGDEGEHWAEPTYVKQPITAHQIFRGWI
jgi:hypothetical protein